MKTFAKVIATLLLVSVVAPAVFAQTPTPAPTATPVAKTVKVAKKHHKLVKVKATTYVTKKGTVVHRKAYVKKVAVKKAKKS